MSNSCHEIIFQYNVHYIVAGWSNLAARRAHNPKVVGSNPTPATKRIDGSTQRFQK